MCLPLFAAAIISVTFFACSSPKNVTVGKNNKVILSDQVPDSISYYDDRYNVMRIADAKSLQGKWEIEIMRRSPGAIPEKLAGVSLSFADSSFAGNAPCNSFAGDIIFHGTGVEFENIVKTQSVCQQINQEVVFIGLLEKNVKSIAMDGEKLLLRDWKGNIVFECRKDK